jgi:hypothetical protein
MAHLYALRDLALGRLCDLDCLSVRRAPYFLRMAYQATQ